MTVDHSIWNRLLGLYVLAGADGINRFAYARVSTADRQALKEYVAALAGVSVSALSDEEQRAFWINLYNALTVDVVLDHYPVKSIRDIDEPWKTPRVIVEERRLSLDEIENQILRKQWRDPRVHYALNCASTGCPSVMPKAFTGESLEAMLAQGAHDFINHPRAVAADGGKLRLSQIFSWYARDFGAGEADILKHVSRYADASLKWTLEGIDTIDGYDYDWSLNEAK
jgi:hypothetical protein